MAKISEVFTFVVPGQDETEGGATRGATGAAPAASPLGGEVVRSVRVFSQRAGGGEVELSATSGQDVVEVQLANGPTLYLHPQNAHDLFKAQAQDGASRGAGDADSGKIRIPAQLAWAPIGADGAARGARGATRGVLGDVLLKLVRVVRDPAAKLVADEVVTHVDAQVDEAVYALAAERLEVLKGTPRIEKIPATGGEPILVFIHGTFSTTKGTFDKLWAQHPERVQQLFQHYNGRVYALDHRTLGASPIENALTLAKALPKGTPVHLVTHSRGGLVAETLARACSTKTLSPEDLAPFADRSYEEQRRHLSELVEQAQGLSVTRIVRVACPARGTLLASKRLDAYLSVFKWTLELARIPVAPQIVDFLAAVAQQRKEPQTIPGLAAQIPDSPLVKWLHAPRDRIGGELRVVAGDIAGDSVVSWLKVLLSDSFFRTDNDLVVQTSSMYGGAPRRDGASFVFDQGGTVSHFAYFSNELTARAVVDGLVSDSPRGFREIGPLSWAGEAVSGERAAARSTGPDPSKPAVFMLPGILGSNLKKGNDRIWLAFRIVFGLKRLEYRPAGADGIEPDGPVGMIYDDLVQYLSLTHEVIEFPFDWRRPIEEEGRRLADAVKQKLDDRKASGKPVRLVAHSMGGLVARAMQLERPEVWKRMLAADGARVLMLGTPNGGSWAPMQVLSGDDSFGNLLVGFGAPFSQSEARTLMAAMPGFLQMQAKITEELRERSRWEHLAEVDLDMVRKQSWWHRDDMQVAECRWGIPAQAVLDQAVALRTRFDKQKDSADLVPAAGKVLLVVGKADFTPDGYEFEEEKGLVYLDAQQAGDGRVTLENARLPGVPAWALDCEHGKLPQAEDAFAAYLELLETGATQKLPALDAATRGAQRAGAPVVHVRSRRARIPLVPRPPETPADALDTSDRDATEFAPATVGAALEVSVLNANLAFVRAALMIGHYRSDHLTGTEWVMDDLIGGEMQSALTVGNYPSEPGANKIFPNLRENPDDAQRMPRPAAVIVVGLGEEGDFRGASLVDSVRQGVISAAQWAARDPKNKPQFELAATLIGSGGPSLSAGQAAQLVAQGVREANVALLRLGGRWPQVGHLQFVELYLDRAAEALRALQTQADASPALFRVEKSVRSGSGALRRPLDAGYRGTSYDFISALADKPDPGEEVPIRYALDTRRARTEVRTQKPQGRLVQELGKLSLRQALEDRELGPTLFRLLVPVELEPYLGGTMEMVLELNDQTAGIPWELMDPPNSGDSRPWAVRAKLLRKLRTEDPPPRVADAGRDAGILIIGEPKCDKPNYPRLPGARREANAVLKELTRRDQFAPERVRALIAPEDPDRTGPTFDQVAKALLSGKWRMLHVSGHGDQPDDERPSRGVVLSNDTYIGQAEIRALQPVPELVFVNCCHLGASAPASVLSFNRPKFAASVAQALIEVGVRCVVAAGWAVDDAVAEAFAVTFYKRLLDGDRFMDAVAQAREEAHAMGGNTWAAYQCYGDPNWRLELAVGDAQRPAAAPGPEFAGVTSPLALVLALKTIATVCKSGLPRLKPREVEDQRTKIRYLQSVHGQTWGRLGEVAEAFADAWTQAGDPQAGVEWYRAALKAEDGSASMKAIEQFENLRVRVAAEKVDAARRTSDAQALQSAAREQAVEVRGAIGELEKLFTELPSMERASLCASAWKRLEMILGLCGESDPEALERMRRHYTEAQEYGAKSPDVFYPEMNLIALDVMASAGSVSAEKFLALREKLEQRLREDPEFWSAAGMVELQLYEGLNEDALDGKLAALDKGFEDLHRRWPGPWMWRSVRDQARFVFPHYARRASEQDQAAARTLLAQLDAYAEPKPAGGASPADGAAPQRRAPQLKLVPPLKPPAQAKPAPQQQKTAAAQVKGAPQAKRVKPKKASGARNGRRGRARRS